ncbi:hypothetical protein [Flexithrix dorotheae]|uniref:hypothetical protein n=1 Tax=Flexithrix dorotheae TaxID=70993 RepID=UPI0003820C73|nr:hypothetical protein [Flexithrix dorotheae]
MGLTSEELDYPSPSSARNSENFKTQTSIILQEFIRENPLSSVLVVGENSEINFKDFDNGKISWTSINLEGKRTMGEKRKNPLEITGDIENPEFLKMMKVNRPTLILLSKPVNHLKQMVAKRFIKEICDYFDYCELILNFKNLHLNNHTSDQFSGADKPKELEKWNKKIFLFEDYFWQDSNYQKQYGVSLVKKIGHYKIG